LKSPKKKAYFSPISSDSKEIFDALASLPPVQFDHATRFSAQRDQQLPCLKYRENLEGKMDAESAQEMASTVGGTNVPTDWDGTEQALSREELRRRIEQYNARKEACPPK
jgi:hypothetical protein